LFVIRMGYEGRDELPFVNVTGILPADCGGFSGTRLQRHSYPAQPQEFSGTDGPMPRDRERFDRSTCSRRSPSVALFSVPPRRSGSARALFDSGVATPLGLRRRAVAASRSFLDSSNVETPILVAWPPLRSGEFLYFYRQTCRQGFREGRQNYCDYCGSSGFGKSLLNAGNLEWAAKVHDALMDPVSWSIRKGTAGEKRIAIMGGSYGGYATLVGLTFTPDIFACGIDIIGPSSLITLLALRFDLVERLAELRDESIADVVDPCAHSLQLLLIPRAPCRRESQEEVEQRRLQLAPIDAMVIQVLAEPRIVDAALRSQRQVQAWQGPAACRRFMACARRGRSHILSAPPWNRESTMGRAGGCGRIASTSPVRPGSPHVERTFAQVRAPRPWIRRERARSWNVL
jgi:hypothetical protein